LEFNSLNGPSYGLTIFRHRSRRKVAGDQGYAFIGSSAFSGLAGQLRCSDGVLQAVVTATELRI
jgi:hypothetical protein